MCKGGLGFGYGGVVEVGNGVLVLVYVMQNGVWGGVVLNFLVCDDYGYDQLGDGGEKDGMDRCMLGLLGWVQVIEDLMLGIILCWLCEWYDYDVENYIDVMMVDEYVVDIWGFFGKWYEFQGGVWVEYIMLDGWLLYWLEYQDSVYK